MLWYYWVACSNTQLFLDEEDAVGQCNAEVVKTILHSCRRREAFSFQKLSNL
ncbi:unnamed protein product, partial [Vitis vinifera]|uniref:Uncharacterized protein n=1 Tax=Vitis vinifera TaxID=29760 RepID=D7ST72_VITVI